MNVRPPIASRPRTRTFGCEQIQSKKLHMPIGASAPTYVINTGLVDPLCMSSFYEKPMNNNISFQSFLSEYNFSIADLLDNNRYIMQKL
jgi:hypothetical protein